MVARLIAHVSDLHLLSPRSDNTADADLRTRFVSLSRPLDVGGRADRARRAFAAARASGADHLIVSGDITEMGRAQEFEVAAELLADSGFGPHRVTLVPGNHDRYASPDAWERALDGPLRPYATTAAREVGKTLDLGSIALIPIDTTIAQSVVRSIGRLAREALETIARRLGELARGAKPAVLVQHHPPCDLGRFMHYFDGLDGWQAECALLGHHDNAQLLHGHLHEARDRSLFGKTRKLLGARAVVDADVRAVRFYEITGDGLTPSLG